MEHNARGIERLEIEGDIREQIAREEAERERAEVYRDGPQPEPLTDADIDAMYAAGLRRVLTCNNTLAASERRLVRDGYSTDASGEKVSVWKF